MGEKYQTPAPTKRNERRAFTATNTGGVERVWHATAKTDLFGRAAWEVDFEDWFIFDKGWTTTGEAPVEHPKQRTNPNGG